MRKFRAKKRFDKKFFSKTAGRFNKKNIKVGPMRGGIRL